MSEHDAPTIQSASDEYFADCEDSKQLVASISAAIGMETSAALDDFMTFMANNTWEVLQCVPDSNSKKVKRVVSKMLQSDANMAQRWRISYDALVPRLAESRKAEDMDAEVFIDPNERIRELECALRRSEKRVTSMQRKQQALENIFEAFAEAVSDESMASFVRTVVSTVADL